MYPQLGCWKNLKTSWSPHLQKLRISACSDTLNHWGLSHPFPIQPYTTHAWWYAVELHHLQLLQFTSTVVGSCGCSSPRRRENHRWQDRQISERPTTLKSHCWCCLTIYKDHCWLGLIWLKSHCWWFNIDHIKTILNHQYEPKNSALTSIILSNHQFQDLTVESQWPFFKLSMFSLDMAPRDRTCCPNLPSWPLSQATSEWKVAWGWVKWVKLLATPKNGLRKNDDLKATKPRNTEKGVLSGLTHFDTKDDPNPWFLKCFGRKTGVLQRRAFWNNQMWPAEHGKAMRQISAEITTHHIWSDQTILWFLDCSLAGEKSELVGGCRRECACECWWWWWWWWWWGWRWRWRWQRRSSCRAGPWFWQPQNNKFLSDKMTVWPFWPLGFKVPPAWSSWIKKMLKDSFFHFSNFNGISGVELRHRQTDMTRPWPLWCDARPLSFEDEDAAVTAAPNSSEPQALRGPGDAVTTLHCPPGYSRTRLQLDQRFRSVSMALWSDKLSSDICGFSCSLLRR